MKRIVGYCLLLVVLAVTSCGKEKSIDTLGGVGGGNGNGSGSGNGNGNGSGSGVDTYQPVTKNSYWKYKYTGGMTGETEGSMNGVTKTVNNILFYEVSSAANATAKSYYGIKGANYFLMAQGASPNTGAVIDLTLHYLNDTASVGFTWSTEAGTGNGFKAYVDGEIKERGLTMTVQGKSFKDVIHTSVLLNYEVFGFIFPAGGYDFYIAKNVGVIKCVTIVNDPSIPTITQELVTYTIK